MRITMTGLLMIWLLGLTTITLAGPVSDLKSDETLVFFTTSAKYDASTDQWHVPIHGWVFEPEESVFRKTSIEKAFAATFNLTVTTTNRDLFDRRVNALLVDNERGKRIVIRLANRTYALPASKPNGHFRHTLKIKAAHLEKLTHPHHLTYQAELASHDQRKFTGQVNIVKPKGLSIISDIDDTVKISGVTDRRTLLKNSFLQPFKAVPGMAEHYQRWLGTEGSLHFVSSSPWQLYPELSTFLQSAGFPTADFWLKSFRFKDASLMNLWAKSTDTKPPQIKEILERFPQRRFILVGDSGEYDPEIYAQIQRQHPTQIEFILIRNVTQESAESMRFQSLFKHLKPHQWQLFDRAEDIRYATY